MKRYILIFIVLAIIIRFFMTSGEPTLKGSHFVTAEPQAFAKSSFYSGIVQPLKTRVITSPADGAIVEMPFQYGAPVKKDQLLFQLSSAKFLADYKTSLMQYVKAKNEFNTSQTQLSEAEFLHKHELISDDEYKMKKSSYYAAQLGLVQAKDALESMLHDSDAKDNSVYKLSIADVDKITQAMHSQMNSESLHISSPTAGVVLAASKGEDDNKKLNKGDVVKQGDVLAIIGDMSGIAIRIKVNELTVNQLNPGQKVQVTGIAFPEHVLQGEIDRVDRQGESSAGGVPTFTALVIVKSLTPAQQQVIHAGMSAKVQINMDESKRMMVPLAAISEKDGQTYVRLYSKQRSKLLDVAVKTGKTTMDAVEILKGVQTGDRIVVPD